MPKAALDRLLGKAADPKRKHALYNTSPYTFARCSGMPRTSRQTSVSYMNGFSPTARRIFERFKFADQIEKLDASNRLFTIVKAMTDIDLHPDRIDNLQMGYLFEHLVMRFNEQSNEEAGDHFTPREVIRLMANLIYTGEQDVYKPHFPHHLRSSMRNGRHALRIREANPLAERAGAARALRPGL